MISSYGAKTVSVLRKVGLKGLFVFIVQQVVSAGYHSPQAVVHSDINNSTVFRYRCTVIGI